MSEITFSEREHNKRTLWIDGSRDRYGEAYFIATQPNGTWTLWENRRPYGINQMVATLDLLPQSWAELDKLVRP